MEAADLGVLTGAGFTGEMVVAVFNLHTNSGVLEFLADAPTDGSTILSPLVAADVGVTSSSPRFSYVAQSFDQLTGNSDAITTPAKFNAFNNSISTGAFVPLAPGASASVPLTLDRKEFALTPALGQMVVAIENSNRNDNQALLLHVDGDEVRNIFVNADLAGVFRWNGAPARLFLCLFHSPFFLATRFT